MVANPNTFRVTDAQWWLWEQIAVLDPGVLLGGFYAFKSGYHSSVKDNQNNWPGDYSILDRVDIIGDPDKARAIDVTFPDAQAGNFARITARTNNLLKSYRDANDERLNGWREFYGCVNGEVKGADTRYWQDATSDDSHRWHIHGSEEGALVGDYKNKRAFLSAWKGEPVQVWRDYEAALAGGGGGETMGDFQPGWNPPEGSDWAGRPVGVGVADIWGLLTFGRTPWDMDAKRAGRTSNVWLTRELAAIKAAAVGAKDTIVISPDQVDAVAAKITARLTEDPDNPLTGSAHAASVAAAVRKVLQEGVLEQPASGGAEEK